MEIVNYKEAAALLNERIASPSLKEFLFGSENVSHRQVKGIGPATAEKIVETFGEETFEVIEKNPEFLTQINGISAKKAREIGESFRAQFGMRSVMMFTSQFFGAALSVKIYKKWGYAAEEIIRRNPYLLCEIGRAHV